MTPAVRSRVFRLRRTYADACRCCGEPVTGLGERCSACLAAYKIKRAYESPRLRGKPACGHAGCRVGRPCEAA